MFVPVASARNVTVSNVGVFHRNQPKVQKCKLSRQIVVTILKALPRTRGCEHLLYDRSVLLTAVCSGYCCDPHFIGEKPNFELTDLPELKCTVQECRDPNQLIWSSLPNTLKGLTHKWSSLTIP